MIFSATVECERERMAGDNGEVVMLIAFLFTAGVQPTVTVYEDRT
jgi:hypothetical protein